MTAPCSCPRPRSPSGCPTRDQVITHSEQAARRARERARHLLAPGGAPTQLALVGALHRGCDRPTEKSLAGSEIGCAVDRRWEPGGLYSTRLQRPSWAAIAIHQAKIRQAKRPIASSALDNESRCRPHSPPALLAPCRTPRLSGSFPTALAMLWPST